jgi:anaerobic selenocysteine-containing dehydrogenase
MPPDIAHSVCPHDCPSTCALDVERLSPTHIGRVHGSRDNDYTAGVVCEKVARYAERQHHPDRLKTPLRRLGAKGAGEFQSISWDQALDEVAEQFTRAAQSLGAETVWPYFYAGTMGLVQRDGIDRLRNVMGYSREKETICVALSDAGWFAGVGVKRGVDAREMEESELIVVWGGNPVSTQVNAMTHIARARKARGTRLVVVDPYRTGTAAAADLHLALRPGTDGALAVAVMHVLFKEGYADRGYMARYTDAPGELEAHVASRTPEWAAAITGLDAARIVEFARLYGRTKRSYIRVGYGFTRSRNGAVNMHAVTCLPTVTGAWQHRGGGALYSNAGLYPIDRTLIKGLDRLDFSVRILDQSRIGPVLTGDRRDLGEGPPVTAMLVQNTNPATVCPESLLVRQGLSRQDLFFCVHEQFLTDTALMADIVLPATTFLEHDDIYTAGGHTYLQVARQAVQPYAEARSNHWVICELARRLGAEHPGFGMSAWEIVTATLKASGLPSPDEFHDGRWHDCALDFRRAHFLDGFGTPDGRFHFKPDWASIGPDHARLPALPDHCPVIEAANAEHPFRLVTAPARTFLNSTFTETPGSKARERRPTVFVHPADAARLGIGEGAPVRLGNRRGSILVHAHVFDGMQTGVLVLESIWPNRAYVEGIGVNALVGADAGLPNGGGVFHDTAVWLRPA